MKVVGLFVGVLDIDSDEQSAFTDVELPESQEFLLKFFLNNYAKQTCFFVDGVMLGSTKA